LKSKASEENSTEKKANPFEGVFGSGEDGDPAEEPGMSLGVFFGKEHADCAL
jgi:hypothetical protein